MNEQRPKLKIQINDFVSRSGRNCCGYNDNFISIMTSKLAYPGCKCLIFREWISGKIEHEMDWMYENRKAEGNSKTICS